MRMEYVFPQLFSPDDVDIRLQYISVSQLEKMVETGKLCIPERRNCKECQMSGMTKKEVRL